MQSQQRDIAVVQSLAELSKDRAAWLCDIWGVLHNGIAVFPSALDACRRFRNHGGRVVLISNSPRPAPGVASQLAELQIFEDCYDAIVTSGDVTRSLVQDQSAKSMFHLGPDRDKGFFDGLSVRFVPETQADVLVCTGLVDDETETPEDYIPLLRRFLSRNAIMICGNPDIMVERGSRLIPCAGALAQIYLAHGGTVLQAGKPYKPLYDLALSCLPPHLGPHEILAIGDGIDTDIKGASQLGIDAVYILSRVHVGEEHRHLDLSPSSVSSLFRDRPFQPIAAMAELRW